MLQKLVLRQLVFVTLKENFTTSSLFVKKNSAWVEISLGRIFRPTLQADNFL